MTIIDSANLICDKCGAKVNHHVMLWPDGWTKFSGGFLLSQSIHFCPECTAKMGTPPGKYGPGMKLGSGG